MFPGSYFPSSYFPSSYFAGSGVSYDDLYNQWLKEGSPSFFTYHAIVYKAIEGPDIRFITIIKGQNIEYSYHGLRWDSYYGPIGWNWR